MNLRGYTAFSQKPKRLGIGYNKALPTVLRFAGVRIVIYPNDHRPSHVHAIGSGYEAVFNINCPAGSVELRENYGFSRRAIAQIGSVLADHLKDLCNEWERLHEIE